MGTRKIKTKTDGRIVEYPIATLFFFGPNRKFATKALVSIIKGPDAEPSDFRKWYSADTDIREDFDIGREIVGYLNSHGVKGTLGSEEVVGCPHEEGADYPQGELCPKCPYWAKKNKPKGKAARRE